MSDIKLPKEFDGINISATETITMHQHTVVRVDKTQPPISLYTTSMEEWMEYTNELKTLVLTIAARYLMMGILLGIIFGFFSFAKADPTIIKQIEKNSPKEYHATLVALANIESSFRPAVVGKAKEFGLFQFHPKFFTLKDKSVKGQVKKAVEHLKWLEAYCPADLAIAWNLGCKDAQKLEKPKAFGYYIKFAKAKEEYEKAVKNRRAFASDQRKIANSSYTHQEI